jgi:hypothetical protein
VKVTYLRRFGCPKSGSPRLIYEELLNDQVSPTVLHQVDEALSMPSVGAVARAIDPIDQAIEEAVSEAVDAASGQASGSI